MIIDYLHLIDVALFPNKADAPPVVNSDTVLACPVALKKFKAVSRRNSKVFQGLRLMEHPQFAQTDTLNFRSQFPGGFSVKESLRFPILEPFDHKMNL
jgi:hypothetical protein